MSLFEEHDPRFVHLERKVGIFVILGIAATVSAVVLLGVRQGVFTPRAAVSFRVASAEDLGEGAEVLTRGFRIGKVSRLRLDDAGKVEVRLAVDKSALKWIKRDSTARLSKSLLVGGAKVVITSGTPGAEVIREGGELAFEPGVGLSETAQQAMEELKPVLRQLTVTIGNLGDPKGDFMTTLANLNRLTANLDQTQRGIGVAFDERGFEVQHARGRSGCGGALPAPGRAPRGGGRGRQSRTRPRPGPSGRRARPSPSSTPTCGSW